MATVPFDTHEAVKKLRDAGFDETQAEAVVATLGEVIGGNLATNSDVADVRRDVADVQREVADVQREVADVRRDVADVQLKVADLQRDVANVQRDVADLQREVASIRRDMATKSDLKDMEIRLTVRVGGFIVAVAGVTIALMKLLP